MILVDSHCHLFFEEIYNSLEKKLDFAKLCDVRYFLTVGTDSKTMLDNIQIAEKYKNIVCSVGIHPHHFEDEYTLDEIKKHINNKKVVAIGEVGLDYHYHKDSTSKSNQINLFRDMLSISENTDLPYIFHARECFDDIFNIISEYKIESSVFHCYTDSLENAKKILDLGYYISFSGVITFKNSQNLRDIVKYVPDDKILIETDCPYLTPVPYRGKTNEPAYIRPIAECMAEIKNKTIEEISEITTNNFFNLFTKSRFLLEES